MSLAALAALEPIGWAGPHARVISAFDEDDPFDVQATLDYDLELTRGAIEREQVGLPGTQPTDPVPIARDLVVAGARHVLTPRLEVGVLPRVSVSVAMPVVLSQSRSLSFDQRSTPCVFAGDGGTVTCIDARTSSTVRDGLLPDSGFDAQSPDDPGFTGGSTIFRGPQRAGLDQLHLGLTVALMDQARDDTKPTWKLGAQVRLPVGSVMRMDRIDPQAATGVGRGLSEVRLWTSIARNMRRVEPYVEIWWQAPFATTDDSAFGDLGFGQQRSAAQQQGGVRAGALVPLWRQGERSLSLAVDGRLEALFEGRAYTEMWEVFQYAGTAGTGGPLVLDADPTVEGVQERTHPGVSQVENHLRGSGTLGVDAALGRYIRLGATLGLTRTRGHALSFSDAGVDLPTCGGDVTSGCEADRNDVINPDSAEVNPGYVPLIDQVGQRYRLGERTDYALIVQVRSVF